MDCYREAVYFLFMSGAAVGPALFLVMTSNRFFGDFNLQALSSAWVLLTLYSAVSIFTVLVVLSNASTAEVFDLFDGQVLSTLWLLLTIAFSSSLAGYAVTLGSFISIRVMGLFNNRKVAI